MGHKIYLNFECQEVINTVTEVCLCVCVGGGGGRGGTIHHNCLPWKNW